MMSDEGPIYPVEFQASYECPVNGSGTHSVPESYELRLKRNPRGAVVVFYCAACGERHAMILKDGGAP